VVAAAAGGCDGRSREEGHDEYRGDKDFYQCIYSDLMSAY
jgi:hypothetical protein